MTNTPTQSPERQARDERIAKEMKQAERVESISCSIRMDDMNGVLADLASAEARVKVLEADNRAHCTALMTTAMWEALEARAVEAERQLSCCPKCGEEPCNCYCDPDEDVDLEARADDLQRRLDAVEARIAGVTQAALNPTPAMLRAGAIVANEIGPDHLGIIGPELCATIFSEMCVALLHPQHEAEQ